jgi:membrane protease YdiL (CAAX protease family)
MIGNLLLLMVWWILLRLEGRGLRELGFNRPTLRLAQLGAGVAIAGAVAALQQFGYALASGTRWSLNPGFTSELLRESLRWNINSVVFEELIFRGYLISGVPLSR